MQHVNQLAKQHTKAVSKPGVTLYRDRPELEKEIIRKFFESISALYGAGKVKSTWPDKEARLMAAEVFGQDIVNLGWAGINRCLGIAKERMHEDKWSWPNLALILNATAEGANTHQSRLSVDQVMANVLPAPGKVDKAKNQARLQALRDSL